MNDKYEDILHLPYYGSCMGKRMCMTDRGAQFSPFAALTGFDEAIRETGRQTDSYIFKEQDAVESLNRKLCFLLARQQQHPEVTVVYFSEDQKKSGGSYRTVTEKIKKVDLYENALCLRDGTRISLPYIYEIYGDIFGEI